MLLVVHSTLLVVPNSKISDSFQSLQLKEMNRWLRNRVNVLRVEVTNVVVSKQLINDLQ